jgi:hypothetical protein
VRRQFSHGSLASFNLYSNPRAVTSPIALCGGKNALPGRTRQTSRYAPQENKALHHISPKKSQRHRVRTIFHPRQRSEAVHGGELLGRDSDDVPNGRSTNARRWANPSRCGGGWRLLPRLMASIVNRSPRATHRDRLFDPPHPCKRTIALPHFSTQKQDMSKPTPPRHLSTLLSTPFCDLVFSARRLSECLPIQRREGRLFPVPARP